MSHRFRVKAASPNLFVATLGMCKSFAVEDLRAYGGIQSDEVRDRERSPLPFSALKTKVVEV